MVASPAASGVDLLLEGDRLALADQVAAWLDAARTAIAVPIAENYSIGPVVYGEQEHQPGWSLAFMAHGVTPAGRVVSGRPDDAGWSRLLRRLRSGQFQSLELMAQAMDGFGHAWDIQPWGSLEIGTDLGETGYASDKPPARHLWVRLSEPMRSRLLRREDFTRDLVELAQVSLPIAEVRGV
jgi:hypothetical protein